MGLSQVADFRLRLAHGAMGVKPHKRVTKNTGAVCSLLNAEVRPDQRGQFRGVTMEGSNCCREQVRLSDVFPRDIKAIYLCQVADELALCSPVPFAERVKGVPFAEVVGGAVAESGGPKSGQVLLFGQLGEDCRPC